MKIRCSSCGELVEYAGAVCGQCGADKRADKWAADRQRRAAAVCTAFAVVGAVVLGVVGGLLGSLAVGVVGGLIAGAFAGVAYDRMQQGQEPMPTAIAAGVAAALTVGAALGVSDVWGEKSTEPPQPLPHFVAEAPMRMAGRAQIRAVIPPEREGYRLEAVAERLARQSGYTRASLVKYYPDASLDRAGQYPLAHVAIDDGTARPVYWYE